MENNIKKGSQRRTYQRFDRHQVDLIMSRSMTDMELSKLFDRPVMDIQNKRMYENRKLKRKAGSSKKITPETKKRWWQFWR